MAHAARGDRGNGTVGGGRSNRRGKTDCATAARGDGAERPVEKGDWLRTDE